MIIKEDRLFPYPMLKEGNNNFSSSKFEISTKYRNNAKAYGFSLDVSLDEKNLLNLLKKGEVKIICHLECSKTKFRSIKELEVGTNNFEIEVSFLEGTLQLIGLIIANRDLPNYYSEDFDSEYKDNKFFIEKGSILGAADIVPIIIENKKENNTKVPTIFDITKNKDGKEIEIDLDHERILISVPIKQYNIRDAHNKGFHFRNIMNSMFVFPVLVSVLNELAKPDATHEYGGRRWYGVINKKLNGMGINLQEVDIESQDLFHLAQKLLEDLFPKAMESITYLEEEEQ